MKLPGLIEHMAQTVALYTGYQYFLKNEPAPTGYIGAIKKVEIDQLPKISQELITTVTFYMRLWELLWCKLKLNVNGNIIATSEMKTVLA